MVNSDVWASFANLEALRSNFFFDLFKTSPNFTKQNFSKIKPHCSEMHAKISLHPILVQKLYYITRFE